MAPADPPDQRIEEAAREIRQGHCTHDREEFPGSKYPDPVSECESCTRKVCQRLYDDGKKAGMEEAK